MLSFADRLTQAAKAEACDAYLDKLYLTNSVLHCAAPACIPSNGSIPQRSRFWGTRFVQSGSNKTLELTSNEDTNANNFRVDTSVGRFLSFTKDHNHIRTCFFTIPLYALVCYLHTSDTQRTLLQVLANTVPRMQS